MERALAEAKFLDRPQRLALKHHDDLSKTFTKAESRAISDLVSLQYFSAN